MASSEGNSWIAERELEELPLIFWRFYSREKVKLVKVV